MGAYGSPMGVEVIVVQHAEKIRTSGDPELTDEGNRQAASVALWLAENHPDVGRVIASSSGALRRPDARSPTRSAWS